MKIMGISGSLRKGSSNTALLHAMTKLTPEGTEFTVAAPLDRLPYVNPDIDGDNQPDSVRAWRTSVGETDGLIICSPEYAHGIPGVLKNALDWLVASGELYEKPVALVNASPNYLGAQRVTEALGKTLNAQQARLRRDTIINIAGVYNKLDDQGRLTDDETRTILTKCLRDFAREIRES